MARTPKGTPPSYPQKPHNGQARISVRLANGRRADICLGPHGSPESRAEYRRVLAELEANGGRFPVRDGGEVSTGLSVNEVCLRFWKHAECHYRLGDGSPSRGPEIFRYALEPLVDLYGHTLAAEFGPLKLKAVRQAMIDSRYYLVRFTEKGRGRDIWVAGSRFRRAAAGPGEYEARRKKQWSPVELLKEKKAFVRRVVNQRIEHVKRLFKWAVSEELVPPSVYEGLKTVAGLRRGHPGIRESTKVKPVPQEHVDATLPFLPPQVAAMVRLQPLMGARETEICSMRGRNIDTSGPVWWYRIDPNEIPTDGRPAAHHKTAHHEDAGGHAQVKLLPIGPKAQEILKPWLRDDPDEYLFQPREARRRQNAERRKGRKTPLWPSHAARQERKRKANPKRAPRERYDRHSYTRAVARACEKAGVSRWNPHRLKHVCGTEVRKKYGLEAAMAYMGHSKLSTAEIYAERNQALVEQIALEMG